MVKYLIDTNHVSKILTGDEEFTRKLKKVKGSGNIFGISTTVLGELYFAAYASRNKEENLTHLESFLESVVLWNYDRLAAKQFGKIQAKQKEKGKPIPPIDVQIAAVAIQNDLTVLTNDRHFSFIGELRTENWFKE